MRSSTVSGRITFVLIPGAGIDPGAWSWTIAALGALGHEAVAPALPVHDPGARPTAHAAAIVDSVRDLAAPLVVVGHSLGAFAAPLVATRVAVSALILLAPMMEGWGPEAVREVFLHDVPTEMAEAAERFDRAPGRGMFSEPWPLRAWPEVPTRLLVPREDRLFPLAFQQRVACERLGLPVLEMPGGHLPMLARPDQLAARLAGVSAGRWKGTVPP